MGRGLVYRCTNCGKEYHVLVGSGFVFPEVYRETLLRVLNGEYGLITEKELFVNWDMFRMLQVVILKKCIG